MPASIHDTYGAAMQHDIDDVPDHVMMVGVARRPTPWLYDLDDENVPELGPLEAMLDACKERARSRQREV